jgi:hypothetical protein
VNLFAASVGVSDEGVAGDGDEDADGDEPDH